MDIAATKSEGDIQAGDKAVDIARKKGHNKTVELLKEKSRNSGIHS